MLGRCGERRKLLRMFHREESDVHIGNNFHGGRRLRGWVGLHLSAAVQYQNYRDNDG